MGEKLATSRSSELISATKREADGFLVYQIELKGEKYHEIIALSINKGKLYRLSCVSPNTRWGAAHLARSSSARVLPLSSSIRHRGTALNATPLGRQAQRHLQECGAVLRPQRLLDAGHRCCARVRMST